MANTVKKRVKVPASTPKRKQRMVCLMSEEEVRIVDAYLNAELGSGYEWWHNFYEFHKLAIDELEAFDYEEYKANGFKVNKLGDYDLTLDFDKKPE